MLVIGILALGGCAADDDPGGTAIPTVGAGQTMPAEGSIEAVENAAVADLATRLKVEPEAIEVVQSEATTWPDGSLGCPEPGKFYTQALVEGYRVILRHDGRLYVYPAGSDGIPFLCGSPEGDGGRDFVPPPGYEE